jgi:hypothetical protein
MDFIYKAATTCYEELFVWSIMDMFIVLSDMFDLENASIYLRIMKNMHDKN